MNQFNPKQLKALVRDLAAAFGTPVGPNMSKADKRYLVKIDKCIDEIAEIRRAMRKSDAEISRLKKSTRSTLKKIQTNFRDTRPVRAVRTRSRRNRSA